MKSSKIQLSLTVAETNAEPERLDELTGRLLQDLRDLGAESVERISSEAAPKGAKGDAFTLGALALVAVPAFLPKLVEFLQTWSMRGENRKIRIKAPNGVEVEFAPAKKLSEGELVALVEKIGKISI